jgi:hypothetical protein
MFLLDLKASLVWFGFIEKCIPETVHSYQGDLGFPLTTWRGENQIGQSNSERKERTTSPTSYGKESSD